MIISDFDPVPIVLECDKDLPKKEQTIWHIRPKTSRDGNRSQCQYGRAHKTDKDGYDEFDEHRLNDADANELARICVKVENLCPNKLYAEAHKELMATAKKGPRGLLWIPVIEKEEDIKDIVIYGIDQEYLNELIRAAARRSVLEEYDRKK